MTELLAARAQQVVAIEVDRELARMLQQKFSNKLGIEVLEADILLSDLASLCRRYQREQCFVFGNLPYYITSPIIHHLLDFAGWISGMGLVVQREVAERLSALPGSRPYGYLTVLTQLGTNPRIEFGIPPGAFSPPPKVDSALVTFQMKPERIQPPGGGAEDAAGVREIVLRAQAEEPAEQPRASLRAPARGNRVGGSRTASNHSGRTVGARAV